MAEEKQTASTLAAGAKTAAGSLLGGVGGALTAGVALAAVGAAVATGVALIAPDIITNLANTPGLSGLVTQSWFSGSAINYLPTAAAGAAVGGALGVVTGGAAGTLGGLYTGIQNSQAPDNSNIVHALEKQQAQAAGLMQGAMAAKIEQVEAQQAMLALQAEAEAQQRVAAAHQQPQKTWVQRVEQQRSVNLAQVPPVGRA